MLELGASGSDRREPAVCHVPALAAEVEVLQVWASGGVTLLQPVRLIATAPWNRSTSPVSPASMMAHFCGPPTPGRWRRGAQGAGRRRAIVCSPREGHHPRPGVAVTEHHRQHLIGEWACRHGHRGWGRPCAATSGRHRHALQPRLERRGACSVLDQGFLETDPGNIFAEASKLLAFTVFTPELTTRSLSF